MESFSSCLKFHPTRSKKEKICFSQRFHPEKTWPLNLIPNIGSRSLMTSQSTVFQWDQLGERKYSQKNFQLRPLIQITGIDFFSRFVYIKLQNKTQIKNTNCLWDIVHEICNKTKRQWRCDKSKTTNTESLFWSWASVLKWGVTVSCKFHFTISIYLLKMLSFAKWNIDWNA